MLREVVVPHHLTYDDSVLVRTSRSLSGKLRGCREVPSLLSHDLREFQRRVMGGKAGNLSTDTGHRQPTGTRNSLKSPPTCFGLNVSVGSWMEIKRRGGVTTAWYGGGRNDAGCPTTSQRMNWTAVFAGASTRRSIHVIVGVSGARVRWDNPGGPTTEPQQHNY